MRLLANLLPILALAAFGLVGYTLYNAQMQFKESPEGKRQAQVEKQKLESLTEAENQKAESVAELEKHSVQGLTEVLGTARSENKKTVIIFTATWCGSCKYFKREVLPDQRVQSQLGRFVWAFLDVDDKANREAHQKFGIHGVPTIIVLNQAGKELERIEGAPDEDMFSQFLAKY